ncbi:MAG: hypothetical protein JXR95_12540 [Deltaproteobacteria bacterium]|nr:hypothetical protein [Deltaproteobacteria bacterium]
MFDYSDKRNKEVVLPDDETSVDELEFLVFDTETCGLWKGSRIVELGMCLVTSDTIGEVDVIRVNPGVKIPDDATKIHGITDSDVKNSPLIGEVLKKFFGESQNRILVAHNAPYDEGILSTEAARNAMYAPRFPVIDTLKMSRVLLEQLESYTLGHLSEVFGFPHTKAHTAGSDVIATSHLLHLLLKHLKKIDEGKFKYLRNYGGMTTIGNSAGFIDKFPDKFSFLRIGIVTKADVEIMYSSAKTTIRFPVTLQSGYNLENHDYIEGRDHRNNEIKVFRLDRIENIYPMF